MYPGVQLEWPHKFVAWMCYCSMAMVVGEDDDMPAPEFVTNFSMLLSSGCLQVPR